MHIFFKIVSIDIELLFDIVIDVNGGEIHEKHHSNEAYVMGERFILFDVFEGK